MNAIDHRRRKDHTALRSRMVCLVEPEKAHTNQPDAGVALAEGGDYDVGTTAAYGSVLVN
jgi:hypothetical protein